MVAPRRSELPTLDHQPQGVVPPTVCWALSHPSIKKMPPQGCLQANLIEGFISSIESASSQMILTCIKLTKPNPHPSLRVDHQARISGLLLSAHQGLGLVLLHWI